MNIGVNSTADYTEHYNSFEELCDSFFVPTNAINIFENLQFTY